MAHFDSAEPVDLLHDPVAEQIAETWLERHRQPTVLAAPVLEHLVALQGNDGLQEDTRHVVALVHGHRLSLNLLLGHLRCIHSVRIVAGSRRAYWSHHQTGNLVHCWIDRTEEVVCSQRLASVIRYWMRL